MEQPGWGLSAAVAGELRAVMGRKGMSQRQLAMRMHRDNVWLSRRVGKTPTVNMTLEEAAEMADALEVDLEGIILAALRACRDSNPKPSDLSSNPFRLIVGGVKTTLTPNRRARHLQAVAS
jgi:transcriptional regulator with XRE-family HTH domain